jgi:predicted MFS family arabinose efflux permease
MFVRLFARRPHSGRLASMLLLSMGLFDELLTGFPFVALPLLRDRLGLSYAQVGLLFTAGALSALLLDPFINLLSERSQKKSWILCGLLLMALAFIIMGNAPSYIFLLLAFLVLYPANSAAVGLAEATLIDAAPDQGTCTMTRWTLLSGVGDFLSPLVVVAFVALNFGWLGLSWTAALICCAIALLFLPLRFPVRHVVQSDDDDDDPEPGIRASLQAALHDPLLLCWAALSLIPLMLDEIFLGFLALYLRDIFHVSEAVIGLILTLQMLAAFVGLFLLDRLVKRGGFSTMRLLTLFTLLGLLGIIGLLFSHLLWLVILSIAVISASSSTWYPLAKAQAYARMPANSGVVRTVIGLGTPFEIILPGIIGLISARFGILVGLGVLGLAPVLMLLLLLSLRFSSAVKA